MELSALQSTALDRVSAWYNGGSATPQVFRLYGYAGTGKSTIAKEFTGLLDSYTCVATFTGKAASVLRRKGAGNAQTIHSLIYTVLPPDKGAILNLIKEMENAAAEKVPELRQQLRDLNRPRFALNTEESPVLDCGLVLIDECSMVDAVLGQDLESFGKKILVLGDPGQLPPVSGAGYFTNKEPDFLLDEIHRQAADSPIITLATQARQGERLKAGSYGTSLVKHSNVVPFSDRLHADQVICGRNATRHALNKRFRMQLGISNSMPVPKDKVICLKNDKEHGLMNGTMWEVLQCAQSRWLQMEIKSLDDPEDDVTKEIDCHPTPFEGKDLGEMPYWLRKMAQEFDYGYAITCHKAQGSQWDNVFVENESYVFRDMASRWLYTALTRAAERVTVAL